MIDHHCLLSACIVCCVLDTCSCCHVLVWITGVVTVCDINYIKGTWKKTSNVSSELEGA